VLLAVQSNAKRKETRLCLDARELLIRWTEIMFTQFTRRAQQLELKLLVVALRHINRTARDIWYASFAPR
jgi:hypothetical protein